MYNKSLQKHIKVLSETNESIAFDYCDFARERKVASPKAENQT